MLLNAASSRDKRRGLPCNRLEALGGGRPGQFSIRIKQPWHIGLRGRMVSPGWGTWNFSITPNGKAQTVFKRVVHPGNFLRHKLDEIGLTPTAFARLIAVPPNRVSQIIAGKRAITGDTALRFGHWFGTDPQFWLNLQSQFDLAVADQHVGRIIRALPVRATVTAR